MRYGYHNGYPVLFSDSGTYIHSGFDEFVPWDRPIAYGLFIKYVSFQKSLWLVVYFQALSIAGMIFAVIHKVVPRRIYTVYLLTISFLSCFTSVSFFVAFITPDIFLGVVIMATLILFDTPVYEIRFTTYCILFVVCMLMHNSYLMVIGIVLGMLFLRSVS